MGAEMVTCTKTVMNDDDILSDTSNAPLEEQARILHESEENPRNNTMPIELPRKRSQSVPKHAKKRKSALQRYKANKSRRLRQKRSISLEQELVATATELKQQNEAILLLRKQNEYLRQQNDKFISQYGSYFSQKSTHTKTDSNSSETYSSSLTPTVSNSVNSSQISYSKLTEPSSRLNIDINCAQTTQNRPISPASPFSPLHVLTHRQTNIILSFSNDNIPQTMQHKTHSCGVPVFGEIIKNE